MNDDKHEMTQKEADQDFKNSVARIFMEKVPNAHVDEDGFIVIPMKRNNKDRKED